MKASSSQSARGTLRLSEVARHVVIPEGIVDTLWFQLDDRCREFGVVFDTWQDGLGQATFGLRDDGMFAATIGGVTLSIPRQVAKTFFVSRAVVALCTLFPNLTVLWTAHRSKTATNTFQKLKGFVMRKAVKSHLLPGRNNGTAIRDANGEQEIPFLNGSRILFGAREGGFGRGFDEVDVIVFDEAQILTIKALEDMVAATNQSRFEHGALLFYMGTPPRPGVDPGEMFTARRTEALEFKSGAPEFGEPVAAGDALYVECSADPDVGKPGGPSLDDPKQVEKANPSYPDRTPPVSVQRLRKNLPDDSSWRREGLGVWDEFNASSRLIDSQAWSDTAIAAAPDGIRSFGVAFSSEGDRQSVAGAVKHDAGVHVELVGAQSGATDAGVASLVRWFCTDPVKPERWRDAAQITISGRSHATVLHEALRAAGVPAKVLHIASTGDYFSACSMAYDAVQDRTLSHPVAPEGDPLDSSVAVSDKKIRSRDGAWGWEATTADGDETPMEAISLALWGARTSKRVPGRRTKAVVM